MSEGQETPQTADTGDATPQQRDQTDWRPLADAAANIRNVMYNSGAATNDKTSSKKTNWCRWCKKFWLIVGALVFLVMAVALPLMTVNLHSLSREVMEHSARLSRHTARQTTISVRLAKLSIRLDELERTDFCLAHLRCSDHERPTLSRRSPEVSTLSPVVNVSPGVGTLSPGVVTSPRDTPAPRSAQVTLPATTATTAGPYGDAQEPDCAAYKAAGHTTSGVYKLGSPLSGVTVYCDMDTDGQGGWTVLQRRLDGSVPFTKNWEEYKHGFGNKNGEYWLGNENIHRLTNRKNYRLRIELMDWDRQTRYAEYNTFRVSGESDQYRLTISGYSGDAGDSMTNYYSNNRQMFSTVDRDNDAWEHGQCSQLNGRAGWWFENCSHSFLNGRYLGNCGNSCEAFEGVAWKTWKGKNYSLKSVSMKIRP